MNLLRLYLCILKEILSFCVCVFVCLVTHSLRGQEHL